MAKLTKKDFERLMGRLPEEDYITVDEFYKMFNAVIDNVKAAAVNEKNKVAEIEKRAEKEAKRLEKHFRDLLGAVDKRMKKVKDGAPGKDGVSPIPGVDYPNYEEIRDFIATRVQRDMPELKDPKEVITVDYIKEELEALEGNDRLSFEAINGLKEEIETQFRLLDAATNRGPKFVHGGVNVSGGGTGGGGTTSPLTTKGDLWVYTTTNARLPVGSNNQVLIADSAQASGVKWGTLAGSGDVSKVGTPADDQVGVWTGDGTIEGSAGLTKTATQFTAGNMVFNIDQTIGAGQDNFVLTYDNATGEIGLEAAAAGSGTVDTSGTPVANDFARFTDADTIEGRSYAEVRSDLNVEDGADVTDTANVTAAGALMDSELASIADVKALDQSVISGASPTFGTANMTDATNKRFMTDAQETKLDSVESNADVTDTTNVTAAGALMDSEVDADIKTLALPANTTISAFAKTILDDADAASVRTTIGAGTGTMSDVVDDTTPQLGGDLDCNGKNLTDVHELRLDATPDTDHKANGPTTNTINAGYSSAIGDVVYLGSGGKWLEADASATGTAEALLGIALEAKTDTQAMLVALPGSFVRDDTWTWTTGAQLFLSETLGAMTETGPSTTDAVVRIVGYAVSADVVYFFPQQGVIHV